jgi:hypothetical protein
MSPGAQAGDELARCVLGAIDLRGLVQVLKTGVEFMRGRGLGIVLRDPV